MTNSATDDAARLEVRNLAVGLGQNGPAVVRDVSFTVRAGEILGLVGESGSGKTTVSLALLGHARRGLRIRAGEVRLDGDDLLTLDPGQLRAVRGAAVAYVPQDPSAALNPALRIGTQLREALEVHKSGNDGVDARVNEVLDEVRLGRSSELLRRYPHQLSGGQQQRVALAMAFACRPSLIVLDEPTTGLDVTTQRHVLDTVRNLCLAYGVAGVYVSHDLAVVGGLVANVAVMYAGRIVEHGPTPEVLGNPIHPYTRGLIQAVPSPDLAEQLTGFEGQPPRPGTHLNGCSFAPRCPYAIERCTAEDPPPVAVQHRLVLCLRAREIETESRDTRRTLTPSAAGDQPNARGLSVRGLSASYGDVPALHDVDLHVSPESCVAIVGESGSGKTTLARCIVGMHDNWSGEITYDGEQLQASARKRLQETLRSIQYVFQNPYSSLNPRKTIGQIVTQPLEHFYNIPAAERYDRAAEELTHVSLDARFLSRYPDQLSGGERQRVAIARALIVEPALLVCDEITSALDVSVQAVIVELLRNLQQQRRLSLIFITHNVALVRSIAQTALVLREGQVVESGFVEDILDRPADPYTAQLMKDVPRLSWS
jgi:peptide/nickel transport system ATP-binding protein